MKKKITVAILAALLVSTFVFAEYDKQTTQAVMRQNASLIGPITQAVTAKDYDNAVASLEKMAEGMNKLVAMTPPKGSKEQWDATLKQFLDAVNRGIEAGKAKDAAKLNTAVNEIKTLQQKGHSQFR